MAQTALLLDAFDPLPAKAGHYVPVMQDKSGEREALTQLAGHAWSRVTPVFCFIGDKAPSTPMTDSRVLAWSKRAQDVFAGHVFYVDFVRQDPSMDVSDGRSTWTLVDRGYQRLRKRKLAFVPVFRDGWTKAVAHYVATAHDMDGRGAALRIRLDNTIASSLPLAQRITKAVTALDLAPECLDLMLDLGYLDCEGEPDLDGVVAGLKTASSAADWRNLIVCATTMPSSLTKGVVPGGTVGSLPRHERSIYAQAAGGIAGKAVTYGDYLVQNPEPPVDTGGPSFRPNIRYTIADQTLVARGNRPYTEVGNQDYPTLCAQLAAHPGYAGADFSWGDAQLALCAQGLLEPGGQNMWRGVGSSHHIAQVLAELS